MLKEFSLAAHRRAVQFASLLLLHSSWGPEAKWICNPVLSCHSCILAWFACPVGVFIHYSGYHIFPFLALGTVLLLGVLIGRLLCGWVCPFGFLQDLLYRLPGPKFELPDWTAYLKYPILILTVFLFPFFLSEQTWLSFCRICPASAIQVTLPNLYTAGLGDFSVATGVKLGVLLLVLAAAVLSSRSFCKVICPIGALLAPLNYISLWKIRVPTQNCIGCMKCDTVCPQHGNPAALAAQGLPANRQLDCIVCHECQTICPQPKKRGPGTNA
jgi:ferredoxin-type protein NapH